MVFKVDIRSSRELQDTVRALKSARKDVAREARAAVKRIAQPVWQEELRGNASTVYETRFAESGRVKVSDQNVTLQAAGVMGRKFSGGLDIRESWPTIERGANYSKKSTYRRRSRNGGTHEVTRRTMTGFRPRTKGGYIAGPAQREAGPRVLSMFVQYTIRALLDAMEGKR